MFVHHKGHSVEKLLWGPVFVHRTWVFVEEFLTVGRGVMIRKRNFDKKRKNLHCEGLERVAVVLMG